MNTDTAAVLTCAILAGCAGLPSSGNSPVARDELIAKGATKLSSAQLREAIVGSVISGPAFGSSVLLEWYVARDGSLTGSAFWSQGNVAQNGSWRIDDAGQFCFDMKGAPGTPHGYGSTSGCWEWFRSGGVLYAAAGKTALQRTVAKR